MAKTTDPTIWTKIAIERERLVNDLSNLTDEQWATTSQCQEWTVKEVVAHLLMPFETSSPKFVFTLIKNRKNFDRTMLDLTARTNARYSTTELLDRLRANAENRWTPPGGGPEIPLSEVVVHGQDIRRVLGIDSEIPAGTVDVALAWLTDEDIRSDYAARIGQSVAP